MTGSFIAVMALLGIAALIALLYGDLPALLRRYGAALTAFMVVASGVWILGMVILPDLLMIDFSFRPNLLPSEIGGPTDTYSIKNYLTLVNTPDHFAIFFKTIWGSAIVTLLSLCVCYPIAYFLAQEARPQQAPLFMVLLVIPFWINEILRTFSW